MRAAALVLCAAACAALAYLFRRGPRADYVSPEALSRLALADGNAPPPAAGPRGHGRRDVDAVERADRSYLWRTH